MDSFWQNSGPIYSPTCLVNDEKIKLVQESVVITKPLESSHSSKEDMVKLRMEFEVERSKMLDETESWINMNKELIRVSKELLLARDVLSEENEALQERVEIASREKEEMREDFEKKLQLLKKELEGKEALEIDKAKKLDRKSVV